MELGQKIKNLRKQRQLSQEQLADILNVSRQTISRWESSITSPDIETTKRICHYFCISLSELLDEPKQKSLFFPTLFIGLSLLMIIILFIIPNQSHQFTSTVIVPYSTFSFIIGILGIVISCVLFYKFKNK